MLEPHFCSGILKASSPYSKCVYGSKAQIYVNLSCFYLFRRMSANDVTASHYVYSIFPTYSTSPRDVADTYHTESRST